MCIKSLFLLGPPALFSALLVLSRMEWKHIWSYTWPIMLHSICSLTKTFGLLNKEFLISRTSLMQISLFLVLILWDISSDKLWTHNSIVAATPGLLHNSFCLLDTPLLIRCFCSTNTKFPWNFLSFLNSGFPALLKMCQGKYIVNLEVNCFIFCFFCKTQ